MQDLHFQRAIDAIENAGLDLFAEDHEFLRHVPPLGRPLLIGMLQRALTVGTPATPSTVVRYRGPATCTEQLIGDDAPIRGRHAKGGA